jgi:flagellar protein FlaI
MLQSLDIIFLQTISQVGGKKVRRCRQIVEIIDIDPQTGEVLTNEVFLWDPVEDKFTYSGKSYILEKIRTLIDLSRKEMMEELQHRMEILQWMKENNIREFKDFAKIVTIYQETPEKLLQQIRDGATSILSSDELEDDGDDWSVSPKVDESIDENVDNEKVAMVE